MKESDVYGTKGHISKATCRYTVIWCSFEVLLWDFSFHHFPYSQYLHNGNYVNFFSFQEEVVSVSPTKMKYFSLHMKTRRYGGIDEQDML